jgi:GNAT superfamily N-acetyltransferase
MALHDPSPSGLENTCVIRPARAGDLSTIIEHNARMARETEGRTLDPATLEAGVLRCLEDPAKGAYYIAEVDGQPVGQLLVTREWSDWRNGWFWWIQSVYISTAHRRRGVFRMLYQQVLAEARDAGDVCGIRLYVERENAAAIRTYQHLGMIETAYRLLETDWSQT